jgi:acetyl-CoA acetyltransferase
MMEAHELRGKAAIVGFGDSYWGRGDPEPRTPLKLASDATRAALADAGLEKNDIDGVLTGRPPLADMRPQWQNIFCSYMKIVPRYASEITIHGAGLNSMLKHAALAVASGVAKNVLCVLGDAPGLNEMKSSTMMDADPFFELPYGPMVPALYAQIASRVMHEYGVTEDQLSAVSVQSQNWAVHHPYAAKAHLGRFTIEQVNASKMITWPLRLLHMAPWGPPGTGGAFIVTTAERARALTDHPIYILGAGECETHEYITDRMALRSGPEELGNLPNITSTGCRIAANTAYAMAGLRPKDMQMAQLASNFAHIEMLMLSELGFCDKNEMGAFVESGAIDVGGTLPTNTNGGWLSFGQAGAACAQDTVIEAVRQLRGMALGLQIDPQPEVGIVHGVGGIAACHSVLILSQSQ